MSRFVSAHVRAPHPTPLHPTRTLRSLTHVILAGRVKVILQQFVLGTKRSASRFARLALDLYFNRVSVVEHLGVLERTVGHVDRLVVARGRRARHNVDWRLHLTIATMNIVQ